MLRQRSFFSDSSSDFGGVDPAQALRMDGFDAPQPPTFASRLRESGIQAAETAIAGLGLGAPTAWPRRQTRWPHHRS